MDQVEYCDPATAVSSTTADSEKSDEEKGVDGEQLAVSPPGFE